jgi:hypothetical protein
MAGQGRKTFSDGEVLSAADVNGYLMDQSVQRFADAAARDTAIPTPSEGMVAYLDSTNDVLVYDGSGWVNFTGDITNITAGTGLSGGGSEGAVTLSADFTTVQENLITTEGDLYVGGSGGTATRLGIGAADTVLTSDGTAISWAAGGGGGGGFNSLDRILTSNASYDVSGISGFVRFTIIGGGGGAGDRTSFTGSSGGASSVVYGATTIDASGGQGGNGGSSNGLNASYRYASHNAGMSSESDSCDGAGGEIDVFYADLTSFSTIDVTIGAGGTGAGNQGDGKQGAVFMEYTV